MRDLSDRAIHMRARNLAKQFGTIGSGPTTKGGHLAKREWIDFKAVRAQLDFESVLRHYGMQVQARSGGKGRQHSGSCPLPTCKGKPPKRTFSANLDRGIWQCFACKESGNSLDFICLAEGLDPLKAAELRQAARKAKEMFLAEAQPKRGLEEAEPTVAEAPPEPPVEGERVVVNAPLNFELKSLDPEHPWFRERGYSAETVAHFGLGYCSRGWLSGRIAIPLRNGEGKLVGYAGRLLDDGTASAENPLYLFPKARAHKGIHHEFRISELLYHRHAMDGPAKGVFVAPFIETVWFLWQEGLRDSVSIMGNSCHGPQRQAFVEATEPDGTVWIVSEENDFTHQSIAEMTYQTAMRRKVRWCSLATILTSKDGIYSQLTPPI